MVRKPLASSPRPRRKRFVLPDSARWQMRMSEHEVIIAGGGPTGLMLAGELALGGADVAIVERRSNQDVEGSRASGLHPRSVEVLDQRGIAERFVSQGKKHHVVPFAGTILDA